MPECAEDVKKILFGERDSICEYEHVGAISTKKIAEIVFEDMIGQKSRSLAEIHSKLSESYDVAEDLEINDKTTDDEYKNKIGSFAREIDNKLVFFFEYADDDGPTYTTMEHGSFITYLIEEYLTTRRIYELVRSFILLSS